MPLSHLFDVDSQVLMSLHMSLLIAALMFSPALVLWRLPLQPDQHPHTYDLRTSYPLVWSLLDRLISCDVQHSSRTFQVLVSPFPVPSFVPAVHYTINEYLVFDLNVPAILAGLYIAYYFILEPVAAVRSFVSYTPILVLTDPPSYSIHRKWSCLCLQRLRTRKVQDIFPMQAFFMVFPGLHSFLAMVSRRSVHQP